MKDYYGLLNITIIYIRSCLNISKCCNLHLVLGHRREINGPRCVLNGILNNVREMSITY
jgi:hypothetical protein